MSDKNAPRIDKWNEGAAYEPYVGRWSRPVARKFLDWLAVPEGSRWLDVGCGTGALSQTILQTADPSEVKGIDASAGFIAFARDHVINDRVSFEVGNVQHLPVENGQYDAVVAGLVLNFISDKPGALGEMMRVAKHNGVIAAYVWDYADQMLMMRHFWDAVIALQPDADDLDEGRRFPICKPEKLGALFHEVGLKHVEARHIDIVARFENFEDYWTPFLGGTGPAPSYLASLTEQDRMDLQYEVQSRLPVASDGSIELILRAWAVRGRNP